MPSLIKEIPVSGKDQAEEIINVLAEKYGLSTTDPENTLDRSNNDFNVFYDADSSSVKMTTSLNNTTEEYIREVLAEFPTFF